MKKYEKNILIVSLISLVLAIVFGTITTAVAVSNATKVLKDEGVTTVVEFIDYCKKKGEAISETGKIVVNENGEDQVIVDFNEGIHVVTGSDEVKIDKSGIHVGNK